MKKKLKQPGIIFSWIFFLGLLSIQLTAQESVRTEINFPDIPGYKTLKCDFHSHTVFSDGLVWPSIRVKEAWTDGLDAIAITDHLEYTPHKDVNTDDFNKSWTIANYETKKYDIICIKGAEITKDVPPGHFNAIFTTDNNKVLNDDLYKSFQEASAQKAFVTWNHPSWRMPDNMPVWGEEQEYGLKNGIIQGIEVVNDIYYVPLAFQWAMEKNLTLIAGSDLHDPSNMDYRAEMGNHRPVTLVFAKEKSEQGIKDALIARRTVIYYDNFLLGKKEFLAPLFTNSIVVVNAPDTVTAGRSIYVEIKNNSSVDFEINNASDENGFQITDKQILYAEKTTTLKIRSPKTIKEDLKKLEIPVQIDNLLTKPEESLRTNLTLNIYMKK